MVRIGRLEEPVQVVRPDGRHAGPEPTRFWGQWSIVLGVLMFTSGLFLLLMFIAIGRDYLAVTTLVGIVVFFPAFLVILEGMRVTPRPLREIVEAFGGGLIAVVPARPFTHFRRPWRHPPGGKESSADPGHLPEIWRVDTCKYLEVDEIVGAFVAALPVRCRAGVELLRDLVLDSEHRNRLRSREPKSFDDLSDPGIQGQRRCCGRADLVVSQLEFNRHV